jgi:hypothetical protein
MPKRAQQLDAIVQSPRSTATPPVKAVSTRLRQTRGAKDAGGPPGTFPCVHARVVVLTLRCATRDTYAFNFELGGRLDLLLHLVAPTSSLQHV